MMHTSRLEIREAIPEDAPFILELLNTPAWKKFIGDRGVNTLEQALDFINNRLIRAYREQGFGFYVTASRQNGKALGICGMVKREALDDIDLGFAFLPEYEGNGYGYESSVAMLKYANEVHQLKRIAAITNQDNERSIILLKKLGFVFDKLITLPGENKEIMLFMKKF